MSYAASPVRSREKNPNIPVTLVKGLQPYMAILSNPPYSPPMVNSMKSVLIVVIPDCSCVSNMNMVEYKVNLENLAWKKHLTHSTQK